MTANRGICLVHLPRSVVDELFVIHDHQVSMQDEGIASFNHGCYEYNNKWQPVSFESRGVPNLLRLVTNTNQFGK
jgi:hypothetical protein